MRRSLLIVIGTALLFAGCEDWTDRHHKRPEAVLKGELFEMRVAIENFYKPAKDGSNAASAF